jgi:hypothetical protein
MRRLRAGRGVIAQDFAFVEIKQQISCGITMIMGWTAMAPGQSGRNGQARGRRDDGERH